MFLADLNLHTAQVSTAASMLRLIPLRVAGSGNSETNETGIARQSKKERCSPNLDLLVSSVNAVQYGETRADACQYITCPRIRI